jgi:hypothetical protein
VQLGEITFAQDDQILPIIVGTYLKSGATRIQAIQQQAEGQVGE